MWIMHPQFGFLSIVKKPQTSKNHLTVRARSRAHLEAFRDWAHDHGDVGPIQTGAGTDYAFRCVASRAVVAAVLTEAVQALDYSNFKNECKAQGQPKSWLHRLAAIWREHFQFQQSG